MDGYSVGQISNTMNEKINHDGIVEALDGEHVRVRIVQTSACLHCKIAGHCGSADSKEKIVDVWTKNAARYSVGQKVQVVMSGRLGLKAVFIAFVVPLIIAFALIIATLYATSPDGCYPVAEPNNQGLAAIAGLLTFVIYYTILYFCRSVLESKFQFSII